MKQNIVHLSIALALTGMTFAAQTPQPPGAQVSQQAPVARATIEGTVSRADSGQPLKGARVTLRRAATPGQNSFVSGIPAADLSLVANLVSGIATVTTDGNGRFTLTGVEPGQYEISAERDGFVRSEYGQRTPTGNGIAVPVAADQHLKLDLKMLQASVITGRVITPEGEPAAQATVQAYTYRYTNGQRTLSEVKSGQTNDLGDYRLFWLEPGEYFISVTHNTFSADAPVGTVDVSQSRSGRGGRGIQGGVRVLTAVLGDRGAPLVQALGGSANPPIFYPGTNDPDGAITVSVAVAMEVRGIDFNLAPTRTATVSGRVVAPFPLSQGNTTIGVRGRGGIPGPEGPPQFQFATVPVQLSLSRVGGARTGLAGLLSLRLGSAPVNADGTFEIKGVAPGEYDLTATTRDASGQEHTARTRVSVGTADVANLTLAVRPGVEIRGRILLETAPPQQFKMSNLRVSLVAEDSAMAGATNFVAAAGARGDAVRGVLVGAQGAPAEVAEDGSFTLQNVGAMEYRVRVTGLPQGAYVQSGRIESNDALNAPFSVDQQATMQLQLGFSPGRVSGTVSDERGVAAPGAQAVLVPDESRRGRNDVYFAATTDQNGQFTFNSVPPGRYKLFAWEDVPPGAYQYPDFIRRFEDRGQSIDVNANGAISANARLIPAR